MYVSIIGTGYVGLVTGACFAEFGVSVMCVDRDADKIGRLQRGELPIYEPGLEAMVRGNLANGRLRFTTDLHQAIRQSLALFIAVGTPPRGDGSTDLTYVEEVARAIAENLDEYKVVVTKSTVPVGTGQRIRSIIARTRTEEVEFDVAANPEFLREGSGIEDFMHPDRVIIGADSPQAVAILKDLYRPLYLLETPFVITSIETAELIKYASNAFLATKISFINEMARLCEAVGTDVYQVARAMGLDRRIGSKFLHPGPGYGGSCLPKDVLALVQMARNQGIELAVAEGTLRANERQRNWAVEKVLEALGNPAGRTVGLLGLSFKPNTDDLREAPALALIEVLLDQGVTVRAYDPAALPAAARLYPRLVLAADPYDAAAGADALVLITEWNQFRNLDLTRIKAALHRPVFVDLRNVYEPEKMRRMGFEYVGVGRGKIRTEGKGLRTEFTSLSPQSSVLSPPPTQA